MIKLANENVLKFGEVHGVTSQEIAALEKNIPEYLKKIAARDQGFYTVIDDNVTLRRIEDACHAIEGKYNDVVILGIGGSALGMLCIQQTLGHLFAEYKPKIHVIDNIDPQLISELEAVLDLKKTLFIVITKSGTTPETLAQFFHFKKHCDDAGLPTTSHFMVITDPEKGFLRKIADSEGLVTFDIPQNIGGRFSVLTSVGLLPAKMMGVDIAQMIEGAKEMRDLFLNENAKENLPFQIAAIQYLLYQKGKKINVMMPYAQKMIRFADWYRQLLAESIGKTKDIGITPVNALGVTDQHSQLQLYNEGPNDKLHMLFHVKNLGPELKIPLPYEDESISYLKNVSFQKLLETEMEGTRQALTQNERPNITFEIEKLDAKTLGALFMMFEGATAFLGEMFNINAFDQPGVELSKQITKKILSA